MTGVEGIEIPSSSRREHIHRISAEVLVTERYSASVEERATPFCFLEDHEIGCFPRYIMYAFVETKSSLSSAQSASEKVCRELGLSLLK